MQKFYRPEIDGLRALSVLVILFFHAGFEWASGGFVGVDVFFVISGYLITRNICHDIELKRFSFSEFYIRRIKRLFPALFFTLLVTLVVGYLLFSPADLARLGQSVQYAVVSLANFFFWTEAGYFNDSSELKPLLHTWSLAVEEQYYLLWPALLVAVTKINKKGLLITLLLVALVVSLLLNMVYIKDSPTAVFFLLPFRIFEFALGALCVPLFQLKYSNKAVNEAGTLLGLTMIFAAVWLFDQSTEFPSFAALVPCLGAVLVIATKDGLISRYLLSNRLALKIGLTSYSIYLIHWPLFVFCKYWKFTPITLTERWVLMLLSVVLGWLMWRFIEQVFRPYQQNMNKKTFWLKLLICMAMLMALGFLTKYHNGWPQRYPTEYFMPAEEIDQNRDRYWAYFDEKNKGQAKSAGQKNIIVMGNSHAVDLIYALRENGSELNITYFNSWHRCYNFGTPLTVQDKKLCDKKLSNHLKHKAWKTADAIYLHDHWPQLDLKNLKQRLIEIRDISQAPITVFGPKMTYLKRVPDIILSHMRMSSINEFAKQFSHKLYLNNLNRQVKNMIDNTEIEQVSFVDILSIQCGEKIDHCEIVSKDNNQFLYFDYSHFTLQGAKEFGAKLKAVHPALF
ncbi:MAG: acyltransferase family protein [Marinicella sp.]